MQDNLAELMRSLLEDKKVYIADVGATGGPEVRWKKWEELCYFYTFDPDPRTQPWNCQSKNYPFGLWSKSCTKTLSLSAYPPATSLFKMNHAFMEAFLCHDSLQEIGEEKIQLATLNEVLHDQPLDFLKVDAEGAELEILKGAKEIIQTHCLGLQVEVCFSEIRHKAPLFSDLDRFVRGFDFQLFQLHREHWIRKNNISTFDSASQLIWGNALYLLSKNAFLKRLETSNEPEQLFLKYIVILFSYQLYDYAYELCQEVTYDSAKRIQHALEAQTVPKSTYVAKLLFSLLVGTGKYMCCFSTRSKRHRARYLKRKVRQLGQACLYLGKHTYALYD